MVHLATLVCIANINDFPRTGFVELERGRLGGRQVYHGQLLIPI